MSEYCPVHPNRKFAPCDLLQLGLTPDDPYVSYSHTNWLKNPIYQLQCGANSCMIAALAMSRGNYKNPHECRDQE